MSDELNFLPLYGAMHRPNLMAGCERLLFLLTGLIAALLIFGALTWWSSVAGGVLWFGVVAALRAMAKADPQMSQIYMKYTKYQPFYAAVDTPWAQLPQSK